MTDHAFLPGDLCGIGRTHTASGCAYTYIFDKVVAISCNSIAIVVCCIQAQFPSYAPSDEFSTVLISPSGDQRTVIVHIHNNYLRLLKSVK